MAKAGLRKIRFHDLRHTFGSLLIQSGASIVYVKQQMGHSSIQVTVDTYGHLIPGANVSFVDKLDEIPAPEAKTTPHQSAPGTHQRESECDREIAEVADLIGGGGRTRTYDLRIMSQFIDSENKEKPAVPSANSGKVLQNPQPPRNKKSTSKASAGNGGKGDTPST